MQEKHYVIKTVLKMVILLIASAVVGTILLCAAHCLPTERIRQNVKESVDILVEEGDHFNLFSKKDFMKQDNYTDANYLNAAMVDNSAKGIFTGLYGIEYENTLEKIEYDSPVTVLNNVFAQDAVLGYKEYGRRFWNGYEIFVKLLLELFTYKQIRYINCFLELTLLAILMVLLHKNHLDGCIFPVAVSYLFLSPIPMAGSLSFCGYLYCTYIFCIVMLKYNDTIQKRRWYPLFFMFVGICVAYFNMNYFQLISFGYITIIYYLLNGFPKTKKTAIFGFISMFVCWGAGFFGMYVMKWVVYELCTGLPLISDMIARTMYRISATAYYTGPPISRLEALGRNIYNTVTNFPWMIVEIGYCIWIGISLKKNKEDRTFKEMIRGRAPVYILFILMVFLVLLRYIVFANHVYVHAWVMYRNTDAIVLFFNILIFQIAYRKKEE